MDLNEIGTALREGRERKGLSVEAVEEKTKIAPAVITALEEGNRERFPHPVYAKGFVRSYALLLGLDAVELCAHFSREYPVPADTEHPEAHAPQIRVKMHDSGHVITAVRIVAISSGVKNACNLAAPICLILALNRSCENGLSPATFSPKPARRSSAPICARAC